MKGLTFLFALLTSINVSFSQVDVVLHENWNGIDWENSQLQDYDYDGNGYLINMLSLNWFTFNNYWTEDYQIVYSNDANGNELFNVLQMWNGSSWDDFQKKTITYDLNNNIVEEFIESWNGLVWENFAKKTYTYDVNNYLISFSIEYWNGIWELSSQEIYTNNIDGTPQEIILQFWNGSGWDDVSKMSFTYNANSSVSTRITQDWNGSIWENQEGIEYTYDGNNFLILKVTSIWTTGWIPITQNFYTNNPNGTIAYYIEQDYSGGSWQNDKRVTYTYIPTASLLTNDQDVKKELVKIVDLLGRETIPEQGAVYIHVYSDGTTERIMELE